MKVWSRHNCHSEVADVCLEQIRVWFGSHQHTTTVDILRDGHIILQAVALSTLCSRRYLQAQRSKTNRIYEDSGRKERLCSGNTRDGVSPYEYHVTSLSSVEETDRVWGYLLVIKRSYWRLTSPGLYSYVERFVKCARTWSHWSCRAIPKSRSYQRAGS